MHHRFSTLLTRSVSAFASVKSYRPVPQRVLYVETIGLPQQLNLLFPGLCMCANVERADLISQLGGHRFRVTLPASQPHLTQRYRTDAAAMAAAVMAAAGVETTRRWRQQHLRSDSARRCGGCGLHERLHGPTGVARWRRVPGTCAAPRSAARVNCGGEVDEGHWNMHGTTKGSTGQLVAQRTCGRRLTIQHGRMNTGPR